MQTGRRAVFIIEGALRIYRNMQMYNRALAAILHLQPRGIDVHGTSDAEETFEVLVMPIVKLQALPLRNDMETWD